MNRLVVFFVIVSVAAGIFSVTVSTRTVMAGFMLEPQRQELYELDDEYEELKSEYLKLVLENLEPKARADGFVAVDAPSYIDPDIALGYLAE